MVKLRVLGTLDLTSDQGESAAELLGQPKRVALLAVLALHSTRGPVSRDKLLDLFWPELSQERGRRALSQSLYVLRKALGEDLVAAVGQEAVRLEPGAFWCDAVAFEVALERDDREAALSLYLGPFLDGFHLADTPEFERWTDAERAKLERLAAEAATHLADREQAAGDLPAAARWTRRLTRLRSWDEDALIRLLGLLSRAGDASGVRHEYELYRMRLESEFGAEPSPAVESAFAEALQAAPAARPVTSPHIQESEDTRPTPGVPQPAAPPRRRHRWHIRAAVGLAVVVAILAAVRTSQLALDPTGVDESFPRVLVVPFANHSGDADLDPHSRIAADWLSTEIARSGRVRVVPPVSALRLVADVEVEGDTSTIGRALAAGVQGDADVVLGGYVSGTPDSTVFEVFGLDPGTGELLFALDPVGPAVDVRETALERLRHAAVGALAAQLDQQMREWTGPASKPPSFASYQEYSRALDTFLEVNRESQARAADMFVEAYRADTTFTAPLVWAIFAMWNSGQGDRADSLAHSLEPRMAAMPEWDRAMLRFHLAFLHGDLAAQYREAAEVVELAPDSEWRWLLAGAERAIGCRDRALATLRDLGSRSGWMSRWAGPYWQVRLDLRHLLQDPEGEAHDADVALEELTDELNPGDEYRALAAHIRAAAVSGSRDRLEGYLGQVRGLGPRAHLLYLKLFYWGPLDLSSGDDGYHAVLDSARAWYADRPDSERGASWYSLAQWVLAYRGAEWSDADRDLDLLYEAGWPPSPEYGFGPRAVAAARRGQADRARAILDSIPPPEHGKSYADWDPDFFAARVEAIFGDPAAAVQHLRAANRRGVPYEEVHSMARIDFESIWDYPPFQRLIATHNCENL